jgi:hypothetical protein
MHPALRLALLDDARALAQLDQLVRVHARGRPIGAAGDQHLRWSPKLTPGLRCFDSVVDLRFRLEHYLAKAAEAMDRAGRSTNEESRASYLRAAESWALLAKQTEELLRDQKDQE